MLDLSPKLGLLELGLIAHLPKEVHKTSECVARIFIDGARREHDMTARDNELILFRDFQNDIHL